MEVLYVDSTRSKALETPPAEERVSAAGVAGWLKAALTDNLGTKFLQQGPGIGRQ
jgi:hypothetical protein